MTMFSQKTPFNLADFLGAPASINARRQSSMHKRKLPMQADTPEGDAVIAKKVLKKKAP